MTHKHILSTLFLALIGTSLLAQVKFKLDYHGKENAYVISVVPDVDYVSPDNITGTGQITIKVPTNKFDPVRVESLHPKLIWEANARNDSPMEASDFDYISFGLISTGAPKINYQANVPIPLIKFRNAYGCVGPVQLVNNTEDSFMPPNSQKANIGNQLSIFGAGGNAYVGNINDGKVSCGGSDAISTPIGNNLNASNDLEKDIFPNPATDKISVVFSWNKDGENATLVVFNTLGKVVKQQDLQIEQGKNNATVAISDLPVGAYIMELRGLDWTVPFERFVKVE